MCGKKSKSKKKILCTFFGREDSLLASKGKFIINKLQYRSHTSKGYDPIHEKNKVTDHLAFKECLFFKMLILHVVDLCRMWCCVHSAMGHQITFMAVDNSCVCPTIQNSMLLHPWEQEGVILSGFILRPEQVEQFGAALRQSVCQGHVCAHGLRAHLNEFIWLHVYFSSIHVMCMHRAFQLMTWNHKVAV